MNAQASSPRPYARVGVIGGGAWGTALAQVCAQADCETTLWAREPEVVEAINARSENPVFLPGAPLDPRLKATGALGEAVAADALLFVAPAQHARTVFGQIAALAPEGRPVALCSKGLEQASGKLMTGVLAEVWPAALPAVLSGPSFARDVAAGLPTAVTLACADIDAGGRWIATVGAAHFRPYLSDDLVGVELGGAVKNVLAIACGIVEGRALGESARAALIARGFVEFSRLGAAMGAKPETLAGLAGLGDLILTCASRQSRNMSLGYELGRGRALADILAERRTVAEGVATSAAVVALAREKGVEMPICAAVADIVAGRAAVGAAINALLARPFRTEGE